MENSVVTDSPSSVEQNGNNQNGIKQDDVRQDGVRQDDAEQDAVERGTDARSVALENFGDAYSQVARSQRRLRGRDAMQPGRLTAPQVNLLRPLLLEGPMSSGQLAEAAGLTPATTTHMLDQLAVSGAVERERQEADKRVVITRLTDEGQEMLESRLVEMRQAWDAALEHLSDEELDHATKAIEAVCRFVDDL